MTPKRIQRKRTKGYRLPPDAVYVGRPSKWGNPYSVTRLTTAEGAVVAYRDLIERFAASDRECWMSDDLSVWDRRIVEHIRTGLAGKDLACWCPLDCPCHADVLLEIANGGEL